MREIISSWPLQERWSLCKALRKGKDFNRQKKGERTFHGQKKSLVQRAKGHDRPVKKMLNGHLALCNKFAGRSHVRSEGGNSGPPVPPLK